MAKTKISEWSQTAANNTDLNSISCAEGMAPSDVNNWMRELMAQVKDFQVGADGDPLTVAGTFVAQGRADIGGALNVTGATALTGTLTAAAGIVANITGNVTGNVTGDVSGTALNVTGTVAVANGGTGATSLTANNVILGNGTSAVQVVAPGTSGNVLTSNGTTWESAAAPTGITTTTGSAPYYGARAFVNFNGANGSIRASANVSGVVRNSTGKYTVSFTTAMADANYVVCVGGNYVSDGSTTGFSPVVYDQTTTGFKVNTWTTSSSGDWNSVQISVFR